MPNSREPAERRWLRRISADQLHPQRNNFNAVRLVLASCVIWTHCYWLLTGVPSVDETSSLIGRPIAWLAVNGFFVVSGFLVCQSMLHRSGPVRFGVMRVARIWPGLVVCVLVTVIIYALMSGHAARYLSSRETLIFLAKNFTQLKAHYTLPAFDLDGGLMIVNGSLWTITWELRCYAVLGLLYLVPAERRARVVAVVAVASMAVCATWITAHDLLPGFPELGRRAEFYSSNWSRLWGCFATGMFAAIYWRHIPVMPWAVPLMWLVVMAEYRLFGTMLLVTPATFYTVFIAAFGQRRAVAFSANWQDFSYGMYIYAFPVMVAIHHFWPMESHVSLAAMTFVATLAFAAASWLLVEKPALSLARRRMKAREAARISSRVDRPGGFGPLKTAVHRHPGR